MRAPELPLVSAPERATGLHLGLRRDPLDVETLGRASVDLTGVDVEPRGCGCSGGLGEASDEDVHVLRLDRLVLQEEDAPVADW